MAGATRSTPSPPSSCPTIVSNENSSTPRPRTAKAATVTKTTPIGPPSQSTGSDQIAGGGTNGFPSNSSTTVAMTLSTAKPTVKLTIAATSGLPAATATRPFSPCWKATSAPAAMAKSTSAGANDPSVIPPCTASATPATHNTAATTRGPVTGRRPPGPTPSRSATSEFPVWPATTATVNSATPRVGTTSPWAATNIAPPTPPSIAHQGSRGGTLPSTRRCNLRSPVRLPGLTSTTTASITKPAPKDTAAASNPLLTRTANSPLIRAWITANTPTNTASEPSRTTCTCRCVGG